MMVNFFLTKFLVVLPHQKLSWASVSSILLFYHPLSVIPMVPKLPATRSIYELPDVQAGFRKGRGTRDQITDICWIIEKGRELKKYILMFH